MRVYLDNGNGTILANGDGGRLLISAGPDADMNLLARLWDLVAREVILRFAATEDRAIRLGLSETAKNHQRAAGMRRIVAAFGGTSKVTTGAQKIARGSISGTSIVRGDVDG